MERGVRETRRLESWMTAGWLSGREVQGCMLRGPLSHLDGLLWQDQLFGPGLLEGHPGCLGPSPSWLLPPRPTLTYPDN